MPRYFFHLDEPGNVVWDKEGRELPDLEAAKEAAMLEARAVMREQVTKGHLSLSSQVHVADEEGTCLAIIGFRKAVQITGLSGCAPPNSDNDSTQASNESIAASGG